MRWLYSRRMREAEKAWEIYRGVGSTEKMPPLFHAGFSMGASAFARFVNENPDQPNRRSE